LHQTYQRIRTDYGLPGLYRGITPNALRDGGFTVGFLVLTDKIKNNLPFTTHTNFGDSVISGVLAALIAMTFTHPFDTIQTNMQKDLEKVRYKNTVDCLIKLYTLGVYNKQTGMVDKGYKALFKGLFWRGLRGASAISLMSYLNTELSKFVK
jgi:hypothetical protein